MSYETKTGKVVSVWLSHDSIRALEWFAQETGSSKSEVVSSMLAFMMYEVDEKRIPSDRLLELLFERAQVALGVDTQSPES